MAIEIDSLELNISASASEAATGLDTLLSKLEAIKRIAESGIGLTKISKEINTLGNGLKKIAAIDTGSFATKLQEVFGAFSQLNLNLTGLKELSVLPRGDVIC